jgi:hypothetical protein
MKKLALGGGIALVVLVVGVAVCIHLFLDSGIKKGVETVGPSLTKTSVTLDGVSLSLLSGSGSIKGFVIGNPEGYKTPSAIKVGEAKLALKPSSLFGDKVVVNTINVQAPEITFETDLKGNNLSKIIANLESFSGPSDSKAGGENKGASRKLQVDDFLVTGGKINVSVTALGGKSVSVPLPDIHLEGLGQGPEGITAADLSKKVLKLVLENASKAAADAVGDLSKQALDVTKGIADDPVGSAGKAAEAVKGLGGFLKKKK